MRWRAVLARPPLYSTVRSLLVGVAEQDRLAPRVCRVIVIVRQHCADNQTFTQPTLSGHCP